jgi:glycosyltransferase involved in cell wall biosynthesis
VRILHLSHGYPPAVGGSEQVMRELSERLASRHSVTVVTTTALSTAGFREAGQPSIAVGEEIVRGVLVRRHRADPRLAPRIRRAQESAFRFRLPGNGALRTIYDGPLAPGMLADACRLRADVIAATAFPLLHMQFAVAAAKARRVPVALIGAIHPGDRWGFDRKTIARAVRLSDAYVAYTTYERDYVVRLGVEPERVHVIPPGVDIGACAGGDRAATRARLGLPADARVVGFLGQIGGHKGVDHLIQAMRWVWLREPDAYLVIAGASTPFLPVVEALVDRLPRRRRERVRLLIDVPAGEKADILSAFDIFASPSGYESFGLTYVEAWAAGLPVVGCRAGAIPAVVSDGVNGILVAFGSVRELAGALVELIDDPGLCSRLADAGSATAGRLYTWDANIPRLEALYARLVENAA